MIDFRLSCCRLLQQHPLYSYRTPSENGRNRLPVLLLGGGPHMEIILREILCGGQLLDTDLEVTSVDSHAAEAADALLENAPDLGRFVRIRKDSQNITSPENRPLANLTFQTTALTLESVSEILLEHCGCTYIIISTEDDAQNHGLADLCAQLAASPRTLIAYVQLKEKESVLQVDAHGFGAKQEEEYREGIERLAFNLHYAYAKTHNERQNAAEIAREFKLPYNYISNMRAAVHIHSKLFCCGIHADDPAAAASQFTRLMKEQPMIVERLAALEHCRWVMDKLLHGFCQVKDLNLLYSRPDVTTHDSTDKWHCCLVSCDETGTSRLTPKDWKQKSPGDHLDPLDCMSLRIHKKCGELAFGSRKLTEELMQSIKNASFYLPSPAAETFHRMELAICQLWQQKRSAVPLYQKEWHALYEAAKNSPRAALLIRSLTQLDTALAPLLEFISYRDYKDANRLLIRQIPFALTHRRSPVLIKLLAEKETLFSPWQLEPEKLILLGSISAPTELSQFCAKANTINRFLQNSSMALEPIYHIFIPEDMGAVRQQDKSLFKGLNCTIHTVAGWELGALSQALAHTLETCRADYLDVTGGEPLLTRAAEAYAERADIPVFYVHGGQLRSLTGAEALTYPAPAKSITVREMFDLSGAVLEESESGKLNDLSGQYQALWKIAIKAPHWALFCHSAAKSYRNTAACAGQNSLSVRDMPLGEEGEYRKTLEEMEKCGFIKNLLLKQQNSLCSFCFSSKEILSCIQSSGSILEYYVYYSALLDGHFDDVEMGWQFLHSAKKTSARNEIDIICTKGMTSLFISAKMLGLSQLVGKRANNHLNYILYEISLLADRFGMHARPVLAAPAVPQFQINPETGRKELSNVVSSALLRGVYLLGDACFKDGVMGQVLDRIIEGREDWCSF